MPTFFDLLPPEIDDILARHLYNTVDCGFFHVLHSLQDNKFLQTLFNYGKDDAARRAAIMKEMSNSLVTYGWRTHVTYSWIKVFAQEIIELNLLDSPDFPLSPGHSKLLKLRKAFILPTHTHLHLVRNCKGLKNLHLEFDRLPLWSGFIQTFNSLSLKSLCIIFHPAARLLSRGEMLQIAAACHSVETLSIKTEWGSVPPSTVDNLWEMVAGFPCLMKLIIDGRCVQSKYVQVLRNIEQVELDGYNMGAIHIDNDLKSRIVGVSFADIRGDNLAEDVEKFPNLKNLSLTLTESNEKDLVGRIGSVEYLGLSWTSEPEFFMFNPDVPFTHLPFNDRVYPALYAPPVEVFTALIRSAPLLKSLTLHSINIPAKAVEQILEIAGRRLEYLEICSHWQLEHTAPRFERIFTAIAKNCEKLRVLTFEKETFIPYNPILATRVEKRRCLRALDEIKQKIPGFESYKNLASYITNRFTDVHPGDILLWDDVVAYNLSEL